MREKKQREAAATKQTASKGKAKAEHVFKVSQRKPKSQEGKLFLDFLKDYPLANEASLASLELFLAFLYWLRSKKIRLIADDEILAAPAGKLVRVGDLR